MSDWNGTILGPPHVYFLHMTEQQYIDYFLQSVHENRIYSVSIHCGPNYPDAPPEIKFTSRINLPCVNSQNGKVCDIIARKKTWSNGD